MNLSQFNLTDRFNSTECPIAVTESIVEQFKLPFKNADVYYIPNFLSKEVADRYYKNLMATIQFEKKANEGRLTALHGTAKQYKYAYNDGIPLPWTEDLAKIKDDVTKVTSFDHDVCLLNYYESGKDKFAFHSDKEEIGNKIPLVSISFGAERKFYFRSVPVKKENHLTSIKEESKEVEENKEIVKEVEESKEIIKEVEENREIETHCIILGHGSAVIMGPGTHENYVHSLPMDKSIKEPRLNLTFRKTTPMNNPTLSV